MTLVRREDGSLVEIDICCEAPGYNLVVYFRPDTILLTPAQKQTLLERITMSERDARRLAAWPPK